MQTQLHEPCVSSAFPKASNVAIQGMTIQESELCICTGIYVFHSSFQKK